MPNPQNLDCFGFYSSGTICNNCTAQKRCRAILITHGFDILATEVEDMLSQLPEGAYVDSDRIPMLMDQILNGPTLPSKQKSEEDELLGMAARVAAAEVDIDNL